MRIGGRAFSADAHFRKAECDGSEPDGRGQGFSRRALLLWARASSPKGEDLPDLLQLQVHDLEVEVLTGVYSEETHLPQPLRISVSVALDMPERFDPDTPLMASKSYIDLKHAATTALPKDVHFTLIEAVAEHICETLFVGDSRVRRVEVRIVKLAIAEKGESIGITLVRERK